MKYANKYLDENNETANSNAKNLKGFELSYLDREFSDKSEKIKVRLSK